MQPDFSLFMNDAIGQSIKRYFSTGLDEPVDIWINGRRDQPLYPSRFFRTWQEMNGCERRALQLCSGKILDVGAGAGAHTLVLQKRNLDVTALDHSALSCEIMKKLEVKSVVNQDVMTFTQHKFDTILLLMNGFGIGGDVEGVIRLLKHLRTLLTPEGKILGDSTDIIYYPMEGEIAPDSKDHYYGQVRFDLKFGKHKTNFYWTYPDPTALGEMAEKAGLKSEVVYKGKDGQFLARLTL
jgi:SAM-dependent methyltransferase